MIRLFTQGSLVLMPYLVLAWTTLLAVTDPLMGKMGESLVRSPEAWCNGFRQAQRFVMMFTAWVFVMLWLDAHTTSTRDAPLRWLMPFFSLHLLITCGAVVICITIGHWIAYALMLRQSRKTMTRSV